MGRRGRWRYCRVLLPCTICDLTFGDDIINEEDWAVVEGEWVETMELLNTEDSNSIIRCQHHQGKIYPFIIYVVLKSAYDSQSRVIFDYIDEDNYRYIEFTWGEPCTVKAMGLSNGSLVQYGTRTGKFNVTDATWTEAWICITNDGLLITSDLADRKILLRDPHGPHNVFCSGSVGLGSGTVAEGDTISFYHFVYGRHKDYHPSCSSCLDSYSSDCGGMCESESNPDYVTVTISGINGPGTGSECTTGLCLGLNGTYELEKLFDLDPCYFEYSEYDAESQANIYICAIYDPSIPGISVYVEINCNYGVTYVFEDTPRQFWEFQLDLTGELPLHCTEDLVGVAIPYISTTNMPVGVTSCNGTPSCTFSAYQEA